MILDVRLIELRRPPADNKPVRPAGPYELTFPSPTGMISRFRVWRRTRMAKGHRITVKLKSTESPYMYSVKKNKQNTPDRLELKKYDPVVRKHVTFKESR
jgi:large subunit ribosomal protein L33